MKTKLVEYIASEARCNILEAQGMAFNLRDEYPDIFADTKRGPGLDLAVLREKLDAALKLITLLT